MTLTIEDSSRGQGILLGFGAISSGAWHPSHTWYKHGWCDTCGLVAGETKWWMTYGLEGNDPNPV
jgi:hypothetical protein